MRNLPSIIVGLCLSEALWAVQNTPAKKAPASVREPTNLEAEGEFIDPAAQDFDVDDLDEELYLSQAERRELKTWGGGLGVGVSAPWQLVSLSILHQLNDTYAPSGHIGYGTFNSEGRLEGQHYKMKTMAKSLVLGFRAYPFHFAPVFFELQSGLVRFNGSISPRINDLAKSGDQKLSGSFATYGMSYGLNFGLNWLFSNGIFVEYSLQRVAAAWINESKLDFVNDDTKKLVKKNLESPQSWGFANLKLGYFF